MYLQRPLAKGILDNYTTIKVHCTSNVKLQKINSRAFIYPFWSTYVGKKWYSSPITNTFDNNVNS